MSSRKLQLKKPKISKSHRAGLHFPITKIRNLLKKDSQEKISLNGSIFLAAVLEYLSAEIMDLAGTCTKNFNKKIIVPRYIQLACQHDNELKVLMENAIIADSGVVPNIEPELLPPVTIKKKILKNKLNHKVGNAILIKEEK